jgi:hypothetical protein
VKVNHLFRQSLLGQCLVIGRLGRMNNSSGLIVKASFFQLERNQILWETLLVPCQFHGTLQTFLRVNPSSLLGDLYYYDTETPLAEKVLPLE